MTHWDGRIKGTKGRAQYVNTGRGSGANVSSILKKVGIANNAFDSLFTSHFAPSVSTIFLIVAAFMYKFTPKTQAFSFLYILIPFAYILGQTQLLPGYNVFVNGPKLAFTNLRDEWKRLPQTVKDVKKGQTVVEKAHYAIVATVTLMVLTIADIIDTVAYGLIQFGPHRMGEYIAQKQFGKALIALAETVGLVFALPLIFSFIPYLAMLPFMAVTAGVGIVSILLAISGFVGQRKAAREGSAEEISEEATEESAEETAKEQAETQTAEQTTSQAETAATEALNIAPDAKVNVFDTKAVNALIERLIQDFGKDWSDASKSIFRRTRLEYVEQLKAKLNGEKTTQLVIGENFTPLAELSAKDLLTANVRQLADLLANKGYLREAKKVVVDICLMNGGIGSSIKRDNLIAAVQLFNREMAMAQNIADPKERAARIAELQESLEKLTFLDQDLSKETVKYGAKADDLFFVVTDKDGKPQLKSIMNIKLDKILADKASGTYKDVKMVMLVSPESRELVQQLYDNNPQMQKELDATMAQQDMYPVVQYDEKTGEINFLVSDKSPKAPGGHGVWLATLMDRIVKKNLGKSSSVSVIGNSDALASGPIAALIGYMSKEKVGMAIVSVDRENIDRKGGVFGLLSVDVKDPSGKVIETIKVPTILELAQAKAAGQAGVFEQLGFRDGDNAQPFNSNTVFVNDVVMQKLYGGLMDIFMGQGMTRDQAQAEFDKLMLPDLITNAKEKNGLSYIQLEGALGSSVLNMNARLEVLRRQNPDVNKLMNSILGKNKPLVQIVNANTGLRNSVFTPVKFATDFWIQFTNGKIENNTWVSLSPEGNGAVNVVATNREKKTQYTDVSYFLQHWRNADIRELKNLVVDGDDVKMSDVILKGDVKITNNSNSEVMISPATVGDRLDVVGGRVVLENVNITIASDGTMIVEKDGVVILEKKTETKIVEETERIKTEKKVQEDRVRAQTERLKDLQDKYGIEFGNLKFALEMLEMEESEENRTALQDAILVANDKGIDIRRDSLYKEKMDILLSAVIKDHSYKGEKGRYWDEQAREIFRNQRMEFIEKQIAGDSKGLHIGQNFFLPPIADRTGMSAQSLMDKMGIVRLNSITSNASYRKAAKGAHFVDAQMNGGIGSSVERLLWLKAKKIYEAMQSVKTVDEMQEMLLSMDFLDMDSEIDAQEAQLSAKGSDLYFRVNVGTESKPKYELLSITDVKLSSLLEKKNQYKSVSVVMLTSPTSEDIVEDLFRQTSRSDGKKNNRQAINGNGQNILEVFSDKDIAEFARISQATYPSVTMDGDVFSLVFEKEAPGGHGVWLKTLLGKIRNVDQAIVCISNSDAVNSGTPVEVPGYMLEEKKGVVVLVATREDIDRKGGIVGLKKVVLNNGKEIFVPSIMELAQAKNDPENAAMFTEMGFGQYAGTVPFNTNTVLINAGLFNSFLNELKGILSEEEFATLMSPDLIINKKDGYIQLEGALGSAVFNMNERLEIMRNTGNTEVDALLNKYFPNGMVGLVLADKNERTKIFTPFKFAVDFWIQFTSGKINPKSMAWEVNRDEAVNIATPVKAKDVKTGKEKSTVYADVYYLLRYWRNCNIDSLLNLYINRDLKDGKEAGIIKMKNITLKGNVIINNATKEEVLLRPDLIKVCGFEADNNGNTILENVQIDVYEEDGQIKLKVTKLSDASEKVYDTRLVTVDEFNQNKMYVVPFEAGSSFGAVEEIAETTTMPTASAAPAAVAVTEAPSAAKATANPANPAQKQAINMVIENIQDKIEIKFDTLQDARQAGYTKLAALPGAFVSRQDIERMKAEGRFIEKSGEYVLLDSSNKVVAKINENDGYLIDGKGNKITFKFNAMAKAEGDNTVNISFHLNKSPRAVFDCLDDKTQKHLIQVAQLLLNDRLLSDPVVEDKMANIITGDKLTAANISKKTMDNINEQLSENVKDVINELSKDSVYNDTEIDSLLRTTNVNGIKSVQRQETYLNVTARTDIATRLGTMKNAGVTAIILKGKYDVDVIKFIKNHGFDVIVEVDPNNVDDNLRDYVENGGLSGIRFVVKEAENIDYIYQSTTNIVNGLNFKTIPAISYEFGSDILTANQDSIIKFINDNNVELVADADVCLKSQSTFKALADSAKLIVKVEDNRDANTAAILAKFYGVAICAKKAFVKNVFKDSLKNNPRIVGRDVELSEIFANGKSIANVKDILTGSKKITEAELETLFTKETVDAVNKLMKDNDTSDLTKTVREYILGSMMAFVEKEIITSDVQVGENNYRILVGAVMLMMVNGDSISAIKNRIENIDVTSDKTMSELLNDSSLAKAILNMWKGEDMLIKLDRYSMNEENKNTLTELIKVILIMDTVLPESDSLRYSLDVSLDGIKGILASA
jgi:hypothetical protein